MTSSEHAQYKWLCVQCRTQYSGQISTCPNDGNLLIPATALSDKEDPLIGTVLNERYEILSVAGKGGMGIVYKAKHQMIDRIVAIKMLKSGCYNEETLLRFQVEGHAAGKLHHPNALPVYDYGITSAGLPYIVMEFIQGQSLSNVIETEGMIDFRRAVPIFIQACNALEHAHRQGIVHRDVKPSNIVLLETEGQRDFVKVLDFGIAKLVKTDEAMHLTKTGEVFGTPYYMSPEQCMGKELDARSDVYSLGASMYEALLGFPPLRGETAIETITRQVTELPRPFKIARPNVNIPEAIEAVVTRALQKDREQRFQTMTQMKDALERAMKGMPVDSSGYCGSAESAFSGVDLLKKIDEQEVPISHIQVDKLKAKGRAARLLGGEKEAGTVAIGSLRNAEPPKKSPVPMLIALAIILIGGSAGAWLYMQSTEKPKHTLVGTKVKLVKAKHVK